MFSHSSAGVLYLIETTYIITIVSGRCNVLIDLKLQLEELTSKSQLSHRFQR